MKNFTLLIGFTLILLISFPLINATSLGVSPPRIIKENLLPGSEFNEEIVLTKDSYENIKLQIKVSGDSKDWINSPFEINFPGDTKKLVVPLKITVPRIAELKEYSSKIEYFVDTDTNLQMAFSVPITLTVTNEKEIKYSIKHVKAKQEVRGTSIFFEVHNEGNVFAGPAISEIEITDAKNQNIVYKNDQKLEKVKPFTITDRSVSFDSNLKNGNYWINVKLQDENKNQEYNELVFLEVKNEEITGRVINEVQEEKPVKSKNELIIIILLGLPVLTLLIIAFLANKKK